MSMEINVFFQGKLPDKKALSRAMAELGFPLTIKAGSLERQRGFMPMRLRRAETGVEFDVFEGRAAVEEQLADIEDIAVSDIDPHFRRSANFRWGGGADEMLAGLCGAAALAKLVDGVVFDGEAGKLLSVDEAVALARDTLQATLKPKSPPRRGTRPADIKRYLKPLLKQRSDLMVTDRMVLIRPVRHLLRGAFLDRTSDEYEFKIWPYMKPLWSSSWDFDTFGSMHDFLWEVWQPHFEPLLVAALQQDVFTPFGKITTHDEIAVALPDDMRFHTARVSALVLAGERERAEECIRDVENSEHANNFYCQDNIKSARELLARDIKDICTEFHAREAKAVKAMKLEAIWEPSPFPVEVPAAQRKSRTAEPLFVAEPWLPRPLGLLLDVPQEPGEVVFAKKWSYRGGRQRHPVLVVALTRAEAEDRHQNGENYALAARLPGGLLLLLRQNGRDRHDPSRAKYPDPPFYAGGFLLKLYGEHFVAHAHSFDRPDVDGMVDVGSLSVSNRESGWRIWELRLDREDTEVTVWDRRGAELFQDVMRKRKVTDAEMNQFRCLMPGFGEFDALVRVALSVLRSEDFGELE
jgi:hypothetical protein